MRRREFLTASLAASALAVAGGAQAVAADPSTTAAAREYYQLRKYSLQSGPQTKLTDSYVSGALIPALNRLGIAPVGAFHLSIGPETPELYLLLPCTKLEVLVRSHLDLAGDEQFMKAAAPFWDAPAAAPPFLRVESSLLIAFASHPKLTPPPRSAQPGARVYQIRTYESATPRDHARKVEMMQNGEFEIFRNAGIDQVFYGDTLIGSSMPNLTYMLSFQDLGELNAKWKVFFGDPAWKKLSTSARYGFEPIVSKVTNLILSPAPYSQV